MEIISIETIYFSVKDYSRILFLHLTNFLSLRILILVFLLSFLVVVSSQHSSWDIQHSHLQISVWQTELLREKFLHLVYPQRA